MWSEGRGIGVPSVDLGRYCVEQSRPLTTVRETKERGGEEDDRTREGKTLNPSSLLRLSLLRIDKVSVRRIKFPKTIRSELPRVDSSAIGKSLFSQSLRSREGQWRDDGPGHDQDWPPGKEGVVVTQPVKRNPGRPWY